MIILNNIIKNYNRTLFNDFSYKFNDSGLYMIKGPNGSGKTTLLNIISGLIEPDSGNIYYNGSLCNKKTFEYLRREEYAYIFQNLNLIESLTVEDNLKIGYLSKNGTLDGFLSKEMDVLDKVFLRDRIRQNVGLLSGGEKARISIARALLKDSRVILADEPCASLDNENAEIIYGLLEELSKNRLVIIVSHDNEYIEKCEKNNIIQIIDLEKKENYNNITSIENIELIIANRNVCKNNYLSNCLFSNIKILKFLLCMLNGLLLMFVMLSFNFSKYDNKQVIQYMKENDIKSAEISDNIHSLGRIDVVSSEDVVIDKKTSSSKSIANLSTVYSTTINDYFTENDLAKSYARDVFGNIILDKNLEDNHIIITSIIYDFLSSRNYILNGNQLSLYYLTLYIDDVIERDYSYFGLEPSGLDLFNMSNYTRTVWANDKTIENIERNPNKILYGGSVKINGNSYEHFDLCSNYFFIDEKKSESFSNGYFELSGFDISLEENEIALSYLLFYDDFKDKIGDEIKIMIDNKEYAFILKDFTYFDFSMVSDSFYKQIWASHSHIEYKDNFINILFIEKNNEESLRNYLNDNKIYLYYPNSNVVYDNIDIININFDYLFSFKEYSFIILFLFELISLCIYIFASRKTIALYISLGFEKKKKYKFKIISHLKNAIISFIIGFLIFIPFVIYYKELIGDSIDYMFEIQSINYLSITMGIFSLVCMAIMGCILLIFNPKNTYSYLKGE